MSSSNIFIKSLSTMVPRMFCEFLQSGCNKTRLIELLFEYLQLNKDEVLQTSRSDNLFCSSNNSYQVISRVAVIEDLNFPSYRNEGDTKIILHCSNVIHRNHGENAYMWSPSGDTVVLAVGLLQGLNDRMISMLLLVITIWVVIFQKKKRKMLEVDEKQPKVWRYHCKMR